MINTAAVMIPGVIIYVNKAKQNAAYQQAVSALDVYEAYQTELDAGLINNGKGCLAGASHTFDENDVNATCSNTIREVECTDVDCGNHTDGHKVPVLCGEVNPAKDGDNIYADFHDYYEEMTGIQLHENDGVDGNKFIFNAENGVKVTIDMNDKSAVYGKADK